MHDLGAYHLLVARGVALDDFPFEVVPEHFGSGEIHQSTTETDHVVGKHAPQSLLHEKLDTVS